MTVRALPSGAIVVVPANDRALPNGDFIVATAAAPAGLVVNPLSGIGGAAAHPLVH